jgi:subtilisin family serine protease
MPRIRGPKTAAWTTTFLLAGAALLLPLAAAQAEPGPVVVLFSRMPEGLVEGSAWQGGTVLRVDEALRFAVVKPAPASGAAGQLFAEGVLSVEPDEETQWIETTVDDPMLAEQYGPQQVRATEAWATTTGSVDASVCVVDTGLRHTHEEFGDGRYLGGRDFVNGDDDPMDDQGHGTHVAGIAAAAQGNGKGIAGIGAVGIYVAKVMDAKGKGNPSNIASGIRWCADQGAKVVSLSLGGKGSSAMRAAVEYATGKGALLVAAAGNSGACTDCVSYPAAYPEVLAVTCTTPEKTQCSFSSEGPEADLAAPGFKIVSTWMEGDAAYKTLSGTSMSTPHVAGVAALVWSKAPHLTNVQLARILKDTAEDLGPAGQDDDFGVGLVDAKAALDAALGNATAPAPTPPPPAKNGSAKPAPTPALPDGNQPPVADAGPDATARPAGTLGAALVQLDASGSRDPDGRVVQTIWREEGRVVATVAKPVVALKPGVHTLTLTVRDDRGATSTDTVTITVTTGGRTTRAEG